MAEFSAFSALLGGALIGLAAVMLMGLMGRVAGISGIASALLPPWDAGESAWRGAFVAGLIVAPFTYSLLGLGTAISVPPDNLALMAVGGFLVGFGTVLGNGCTSGHGVCGLARLSGRSLVSVVTFMTTGALVVLLVRHVIGG